MKKIILAFALVASLGSTLVSCSADDSDLQTTNTTQAEESIGILPPTKARP